MKEQADMSESDWEERLGKERFKMVREMCRLLYSWDSEITPNYNPKKYISVLRAGRPDNFVKFWVGMPPAEHPFQMQPKLGYSPEFEDKLRNTLGTDNVMKYRDEKGRENRYRIRLNPGDFPRHKPILKELLRMAYARATIVSWGKH